MGISTEKLLTPCISDYEEGDRGGYVDQQGNIILGTVTGALKDVLIFRLDTGKDVSVTEHGNPFGNPWCTSLHQWRKIIDISLIEQGAILSKLEPVGLYASERVYAVVVSVIPDTKVVLLNSRNEFLTLEADPLKDKTLEAALYFWELEL